MPSNLGAIYAVGINLGHWKRFAVSYSGPADRFDFHEESLAWEAIREF
jgi:hypothetical protein